MKKLIGGILIATVLSKSQMADTSIFTYEILRSQREVAYIQKITEAKKNKTTAKDVDELISEISKNNREMGNLLKEKESMLSKISILMGLKSKNKVNMSQSQIAVFTNFNSMYQSKNKILRESLIDIDKKKNVRQVKALLLNEDENTDYDSMYYELKGITTLQNKIINILNYIIDYGKSLNMVLQAA